jgi:hypothetical protein
LAGRVTRKHLNQTLAGAHELILRARELGGGGFGVDGLRLALQDRFLALDRLDRTGGRIELSLLVPESTRGKPTDQHDGGRDDGEGQHPVIAMAMSC